MASSIIPANRIAQSIHSVRGRKVLPDFDLALLYEVTTSALNQAVRRNRDRFPDDFVFLSSVLKSGRAAKVNVAIMRAFVQLREALDNNRELARKFEQLQVRVGKHDDEIAATIEPIRQLIAPKKKPRREIGFHVRETAPRYGRRRGR
jgi:hypothetical protein